ncbi:MAG: RNA polymerase sigma factor [Candidatus Limnocylindrales bacterium]
MTTRLGPADLAAAAPMELIRAAIAGDTGAFEALIKPRLGRTYRLALAITGSEHDASDATQDGWLSAWRQLPTLRDPERFEAWLDRIVVNACRMLVRRHGRVRELRMAPDFDAPSEGPGPDTVAERFAMEAAFGRLSVEQRSVLVLHHLQARPLSEIAEVMGIPVGTVKSRLHAARAALERALETDR